MVSLADLQVSQWTIGNHCSMTPATVLKVSCPRALGRLYHSCQLLCAVIMTDNWAKLSCLSSRLDADC